MNIDFIKWMCDKAGLELDTDFIDDDVFKICGSTFTIRNLSKNSLVYALLLQRAILDEYKKLRYAIMPVFHNNEWEVNLYDFETMKHIYCGCGKTYDEAMGSALMHLYEQEKLS